MNQTITRWRQFLPNQRRLVFLLLSFVALFSTFYLNHLNSVYADAVQGASLGDIFLDNIPVQNVNFIFFWIALFWCLGLFAYHLFYPQQMAFLIWSYALFVLVRALFITLTHMGPPHNLEEIPSELRFYAFSADMFFSGHVGGPFLFALLTNNKRWRIIALMYTLFMVIIVLLGHMHYSIDVFAALFISHSLSVIVRNLKHSFDPIIFGQHV